MASPTVAATNNSIVDAGNSPHSVSLPSSISAGDLLVVNFATYFSITATTPAGWSLVLGAPFDMGSGNRKLYSWFRKATGSEGATLSVTVSANGSSAHTSLRITGARASLGEIKATTSGAVSATTNPDPPTISPDYTADWLYVPVVGNQSNVCSAAPSGYSGLVTAQTAIGVSVSHAYKQTTASSSENPGTFTNATSDNYNAITLCIPPAIGLAPGVAGTATTLANPQLSSPRTFNLPAGIEAGELLALVTFWYTADSVPVAPSASGWTASAEHCVDWYSPTTSGSMYVLYKIASGSEGSTVSVSFTAASGSYISGVAYRFSGAASPPTITSGVGNSNTPDPPSHTPGSTKDYLYVAVNGQFGEVMTSGPSGYSGFASVGGNGDLANGTAHKAISASSSENPGTFARATSSYWGAATIAIDPIVSVYTKSLTAGLSFAGSIAKKPLKPLVAAALSFSGSFSKSFIRPKVFTAGLTFAGSLSRNMLYSRSFTAALSFVGAWSRWTAEKIAYALGSDAATTDAAGSDALLVNATASDAATTSATGTDA